MPLVVLASTLLLDWGAALWVDRAWFSELGYVQIWLLGVIAPWILGGIGWLLLLPMVGIPIALAWPDEKQGWRRGIVFLISGGMAMLLANQWFTFLTWFQQVPVANREPVFGRDIGFYFFSLPMWQFLQSWGLSLVSLVLGIVAILYYYQYRSLLLDKQRLVTVVHRAQSHLIWLVGILFVLLAWGHWLSRYSLLFSARGSFTGANYTDIYFQLPANTFLVGVCLVSAIACFWLSTRKSQLVFVKAAQGYRVLWNWRQLSPLLVIFAGYGLSALLMAGIVPAVVQRVIVLPNELELDRPFIKRNIDFTRQAFNLTEVEIKPFTVRDTLKVDALEKNAPTLSNIRLWDNEPLLQAYRQLQEIRPYYQFPSVDVDRYTIGGNLTQVMHSARELDYSLVPKRAQTWVNEHFFYTHGYGITLSPVNVVTRVGLPDFFIKDIPPRAVNPQVEAAIPIGNSAIYYGELTDPDVYVNTKALELDYPQADENIYGTYQGQGGMPVGEFWQRLIFAWYSKDFRILLSDQFIPQSKLLFRRQIVNRVKTIAPFLTYDHDPYLVATEGNLYWVIDAYTTRKYYPYSEPAATPQDFNYIRNSVKVVIDAYHGTVDFFIADPKDAIIQTYSRIYPSLFKSLQTMPGSLQQHLRYPIDLFKVQTQQYATYHMTDPQVFYNKEDLWQIPEQSRELRQFQGAHQNELFDPNNLLSLSQQPQVTGQVEMQPYYLILELARLNNEVSLDARAVSQPAEFALLSPFTPANKQNLIAWMAARCDGAEYGKLLVYEFSRQSLVFGPQQVEARINQNPLISQQLTLWNQQGSHVNRGNLQIIPVAESLLYVQPLYLEAENSSLPELTRVILVYEDRVVMQPTFEEAFRDLFTGQPVE